MITGTDSSEKDLLNRGREENPNSVIYTDPLNDPINVSIDNQLETDRAENSGCENDGKHDVSINGAPKGLLLRNGLKHSKREENNKFSFLDSGVYKAGLDVISQMNMSLRPKEPLLGYKNTLFGDISYRLHNSVIKMCVAFEKDKIKQNDKLDLYKRSLDIAEEVKFSLRSFYDCNYLNDSSYCAITTKLANYIKQLRAIIKIIEDKFNKRKS